MPKLTRPFKQETTYHSYVHPLLPLLLLLFIYKLLLSYHILMRFFFLYTIAHIVFFFSKLLGLGSGYTWPGHIVLKVSPDLLEKHKFDFNKGLFLITGTNGKTTTSKMLTHMLEYRKFSVLHNSTGSNIMNGIVSALMLNATPLGKIKQDYTVLEVDEFTLPQVLNSLSPKVLVLLNLSRDQLDRYTEIDEVIDRWIVSLGQLSSATTLIYDKTQKHFKKFHLLSNLPKHTFDASDKYKKHLHLQGNFNLKNLNAVLCALSRVDVYPKDVLDSLSTFQAAYGRGEIIDNHQIFLAKNPASFNHNLDLLSDYSSADTALLFVLNDNIPDGRDVSWIYDIDTKRLFSSLQKFNSIFVSGSRAYDMAIRLFYSGIPEDYVSIEPNLARCIQTISAGVKSQSPNVLSEKTNSTSAKVAERIDVKNTVVVFPNYSAMLELRKILTGKAIL